MDELPGDMDFPLEIRLHGRGGQGGVTCAKLIAAIYARMGLNVQTFGDYGAERSGAPVRAFTRVNRVPIKNRNKVYRPHHLLVLDAALLGPQVLDGVAPGAVLLINSTEPAESYADRFAGFRLGVIDATAIARTHGIGTSTVVIINTTLVGAYVKLLGLPLAVLEDVYRHMGLAEDLLAAREAYRKVSIRQPDPRVEQPAGSETAPPLPPVKPLTEHTADIPASLQTGSWSTQLPGYEDYVAPCNHACPAGNDVVGFIQALKTDGSEAAAEVLLRTQPLPAVCGRVCPAPCMGECNRAQLDGAVNIRSLERWIAGHADLQLPVEKADRVRSVAVVGGGPAGLSAAYQLALRGHRVCIFEKEDKLGGVLRYGIPVYRLPEEVLECDLERLHALGIRSDCAHPIDRAELLRLQQEYDAIIVCKGFGAAQAMAVAGESLDGVEQGLDFLARTRQAGPEELSGDLVVVGGGNTAIDCARSALRCGAASVRLVYRRSREEMPAIAEEIDEALREGVQLLPLRQPVAFRGVGRVAGIVLAEVELGEPDADGRRRPLVTERTAELTCSRVLLALGQENELGLLPENWQLREGRAWAGDEPLNIWFAGDCATGEGTVAHAIGNGRLTSLAALASLEGLESAQPPLPPGALVAPAQVRFSHFPILAPHQDRHQTVENWRGSFEEVNLGLAGSEEAERCFSCGRCTRCDTCLVYCPEGIICRTDNGYRIDEAYCKGCGICVAECPRRAMALNDKTSAEG